MDYYKDKKTAQDYIERLIKTQKKIDKVVLYYNITKNWGFGKKIVNEHLKLLKDLDVISISPEGLVKQLPKKRGEKDEKTGKKRKK